MNRRWDDYTILIIDDEDAVRDSIIIYLKQSHFNLLEARNGQEGLYQFFHYKPDLVLCDLRMPLLDGMEVLKAIREHSTQTPCIVISGAGNMDDVVIALRLGANDFIIKPIVDLELLEHSISRALDRAQLAKDNSQYRKKLETAVATLRNNYQLLEEDQKAGRAVQMRMLPKNNVNFHGFNINYHIHPSLYLSGDFIDYFILNEHSFAFYLADVAGHGSSSAFITVLLKHILIGLLQDDYQAKSNTDLKPSNILNHINTNLIKSNLGKHLTIFCGIINTKLNTLTYSFGGHYPLPILYTQGNTKLITGRGHSIGLSEDFNFLDSTIELPDTFSLSIFSDGILEILPQKTLDEKEQFLSSLIDNKTISAKQVISKINLSNKTEIPDDIALLVVSREKK